MLYESPKTGLHAFNVKKHFSFLKNSFNLPLRNILLQSCLRISLLSISHFIQRSSKMALLCSVAFQVAPLRLCFHLLFYVFLLCLFTHITSALIIYDKRTLLDIGHCYTNLLQDTLFTNLMWPLKILQNTEENKGHLNNPRRRKKHSGRRAGIRNRLRERAQSPPLPSILLANVQSLENKDKDKFPTGHKGL